MRNPDEAPARAMGRPLSSWEPALAHRCCWLGSGQGGRAVLGTAEGSASGLLGGPAPPPGARVSRSGDRECPRGQAPEP